MKIFLAHNYYQQSGGEDEVHSRERQILIEHGHEIIDYTRDNREIQAYGAGKKAALAAQTIWAGDSYRAIGELLTKTKPDVAHFHNTFPLISPSAYYACADAKVPVVQTLHNPRLLCPAATLFRKGKVCEECSGKVFAMPAVLHGCYQHSRMRSAIVASMISIHKGIGTWHKKVNKYIVSTEFYRQKFAEAALPSAKIAVKPHFVDLDPGEAHAKGEYALFIGRLAPEKGVATLLSAWQKLSNVPLHVRGEGPLQEDLAAFARQSDIAIKLIPRQSRAGIFELIKASSFLVWPSEGYYETFGLVAIEAFACGVPVIASRCGVMREIVKDGQTGLYFTPGDAEDLAKKVAWAWSHPEEMRAMGRRARMEYEAKYTAARNYSMLLNIYSQAISDRESATAPASRSALSVLD